MGTWRFIVGRVGSASWRSTKAWRQERAWHAGVEEERTVVVRLEGRERLGNPIDKEA